MPDTSAGLAGSVSVAIGGDLNPLTAALAKAEAMVRSFDAKLASSAGGNGVGAAMAQVNAAVAQTGATLSQVTAPAVKAAAGIEAIGVASIEAATGLGASSVSASAMAKALEMTGGDLSKITPQMLGLAGATAEVAAANTEATATTVALGAAQGEAAGLTAGVSREFSVLGAEILRGNFSRIPGSLLVMNERLAATGTGVLNAKNLFGAFGAAAGVVFNPYIIGFIAIAAGLDLAVRNVGKLAPSTETATEALKRHHDELAAIVQGYGDASKAVDEYLKEAGRLPQGAVQSDILDQAKQLTQEVQTFTAYAGKLGPALSGSLSSVDQKMGRWLTDFASGKESASELVTQMTVLSHTDLGPLGFITKNFIDQLAQGAQKAAQLHSELISLSFISAGTAVNPDTQFALNNKVAGTQSASKYAVDLAAITALSPAQQADIARRQKTIELDGQMITASRKQQEIDQAGALAYTQAAHSISMADQARLLSANQSVQAAQLQLSTIGMSVSKTQALTFAQQQLASAAAAAAASGTTVSAAYEAQIQKLAAAYGDVQQKIAETQAANDNAFNFKMLGLNSGDQSIASSLRGIYGDQWQSQMNGTIANQLRLNAALSDFKQTAEDASNTFSSTFLSDLRQGQSFAASFADGLLQALDQVSQKLVQMAIDDLWSNAFGGSSGGGGGFNILSLFGIGGSSSAGAGLGMGDNGVIGGFAKGGYTGPGGINEPAGIVHKGEFVVKAAAVPANLPTLIAMNRGYANGGLVGAANSNMPSASNDALEINFQVIHQPGSKDDVSASKNGSKLDIVAMIGDAASQSLKTPGSSMNRTIKVGFGARQQLTRRGA